MHSSLVLVERIYTKSNTYFGLGIAFECLKSYNYIMKIEVYKIPPIFTSNDPFMFAKDLHEKIEKDRKILKQFNDKDNLLAFKTNEYLYHWLICNGVATNGLISEERLSYSKSGWFIWLQNYDMHAAKEFHGIDEQYTYWFDKYFDKYFNSGLDDSENFKQVIECYKGNLLFPCACGLFSIIEFYLRRIFKFDGKDIFRVRKELEGSAIPEISGYKKYFMDFEKALRDYLSENYYAKSLESDSEPVEMNRNRIMHGIFTREISKTDCLKEFCIVRSLIMFYNWLQHIERMDALLKDINEIPLKLKKE